MSVSFGRDDSSLKIGNRPGDYCSILVGFGGEVEVFGHPGDDRVGDQGEESCLLGLLFGVVFGDLFRRENPQLPHRANEWNPASYQDGVVRRYESNPMAIAGEQVESPHRRGGAPRGRAAEHRR